MAVELTIWRCTVLLHLNIGNQSLHLLMITGNVASLLQKKWGHEIPHGPSNTYGVTPKQHEE